MKKILLIEDDLSIRENFSEIFTEEGYSVIEGTCGKDGVNKALTSKPDLIICDITMPDIDGYEVKRILSQNKKTSSVPFIFLTARADIKDVQQALELGADDYIIKPVRAAKLLELVAKRLQRIEELKQNNPVLSVTNISSSQDEKIFLKSGDKYILSAIEDIVVIKAANDYSEVILKTGEKILVKKSLKSWEETLPSKSYLRIHRNTIINTELLEKIERLSNNSYVVRLKNYPEPISFSQRYSQKIRKSLKIK